MQITSNIGDLLNYTKSLQKKLKESPQKVQSSLHEEASRTTSDFNSAPNTLSGRFAIVNAIRFGKTITFRATGEDVMFIEFGTGISYPDIHPLARSVGAVRGGFGYGLGGRVQWSFDAESGREGSMAMEFGENSDGTSLYITSGQPASMPMYKASLRIPKKIKEELRRMF